MTIERYVVAFDVGRAVNPMLIEGQIAGGVAQGIGGALHEEFVYDAGGQPLAANFVDYLLPGSLETINVESLITEDAPSGTNPLGIKGAGEAGCVGALPCVQSALIDALSPLGITEIPMPATPYRLWKVMQGAR